MNTVDATCTDCGGVIQGGWLSGTLRLCLACYKKRPRSPSTPICEVCKEPKDGHAHITYQDARKDDEVQVPITAVTTLEIGELCPNCDDGCKAAKPCDGCDETICDSCWAEHNKDAPCHV